MVPDGLKEAIRTVHVSYPVPYLATVFGPRFSVAEVTVLVGVPRGADYSGRQARIEARLSVLTWMMGANIAMTLVVLLRVFH